MISLLWSLLVKIKHLLRNKLFNKYLSFIFIVQWCLSWWGKKNRKILNHYLPAVRNISINFNKCYRKNPLFLIFLYHFQMEIRTHFIIDWIKKNASLNYLFLTMTFKKAYDKHCIQQWISSRVEILNGVIYCVIVGFLLKSTVCVINLKTPMYFDFFSKWPNALNNE